MVNSEESKLIFLRVKNRNRQFYTKKKKKIANQPLKETS